MNLASIMVSMDLGPAAADRVQLAASLAGRFEAELIGVAARPVSPMARISGLPVSGGGNVEASA